MAFIMLRNAPFISTLLSFFYHKGELYLTKCFFRIYWYDHVIFVFHFVYVVYYVHWFENIVPSLHPWDEPHLIMVYDLLNILLDVVCQYFVEDFSIYVQQRYWPIIFSLCYVFICFWIGWFWFHKKLLGVFPLLGFFCNGLWRIGVTSSLNVW